MVIETHKQDYGSPQLDINRIFYNQENLSVLVRTHEWKSPAATAIGISLLNDWEGKA